jgi:hypothetical protein
VVVAEKSVKDAASRLREDYLELRYCFHSDAFESQLRSLMEAMF